MESRVVSGEGTAAEFVEATRDALADGLGFRPFPGTLNLDSLPVEDQLQSQTLTSGALVSEHCGGAVVRPCSIAGVRAAVLEPLVDAYPEGKFELVAPVHVRSLFDLDAGDTVPVSPPDEVWHPDTLAADPMSLSSFDAVVFDLDGTLVDLAVDWPQVHEEISELLADVLDRPINEYTRPDVMALARDVGRYDAIDRLITEYEDKGAQSATRCPLLAVLGSLDCLVGICTANAASAADRALASHGARDAVDTIVARNTVLEEKPHPRPLLECLDLLDVEPGNAIFVGDQRSDAEAAVAAGTSFLQPNQFAVDTLDFE